MGIFKGGKTKLVVAGLCALLLLGVLLWWRGGVGGLSGERRRDPPAQFSIFYTCDTRGHIEPCGCTSGMAGGISRRQTHLLQDGPEDYLLVDAGDVTAGPRAWEVLELEYILKGYALMGYHVVNIGYRELSLGLEGLNRIKERYPRLISANVVGPEDQLVCDPYVVVELSNGYRCAILGIVDDQIDVSGIGAGIRILEPREAIAALLPELKTKADYLVLLAFTDEIGMRALAQQFFEIDVIVGGRVQQASADPLRENRSVIVFSTDQGKAVGRLDITPQKQDTWEYRNRFATLDDSVTKDLQITALIEEYKGQLKEREFHPLRDDREGLSSIAATRSKNADRYVGAESCRECHTKTYEGWLESKHAHAFATLVEQGHQYNPRCLKCHTVGYMASDGYLNQRLTAHLSNVSCGSCHGRRDLHVKQFRSGEVPDTRPLTKLVRCETCHDKDNSPDFDREHFWEEIAHGMF